jgi:hypothetical protein
MRTSLVVAGLSISLGLFACASSSSLPQDGQASTAADSSVVDCTKDGDKDCASGESCLYIAGGLFTRASYGCYDDDAAPSDATKAPQGASSSSSSSSGSSFSTGVYLGACMGACSSNYANDPSGLAACNYECAATSGSQH